MEVLPIIIYRFNSYVEPMHAVLYRTTGFDEIDLIRPLWEQLNEYHLAKASRFRDHYEQMTFEDRKSHFCRLHESGHLRLDLAQDTKTAGLSGIACVRCPLIIPERWSPCSLTGEFRSAGIGTALVTRGLAWMDSLGTVRKRVSVGDGNESAWTFYRKFGFFPRMTVLEQKTERD